MMQHFLTKKYKIEGFVLFAHDWIAQEKVFRQDERSRDWRSGQNNRVEMVNRLDDDGRRKPP